MNKIIVFEDEEDRRVKLVEHLKHLLQGVPIDAIDGSGEQEQKITYEDLLDKLLRQMAPQGALIVCDKDLSGMGRRFIGLSGTVVAAVADRLGFPLCLYARGERVLDGEDFLKTLAPWEKRRIILEYTTESELASECAGIFEAFSQIEEKYVQLKEEQRTTPAATLSWILEQPGIEDRIALYGSGEQGLLEEIMPFFKRTDSDSTKELARRMPRILGNWLYTSILRFPGILLATVPAASYLNIDPQDFKKAKVQELFKKAKFRGPFSNLRDWWWRHELDDLLVTAQCEDGLAFAKRNKLRIRSCKDPQTKKRAGYYCMVTEEPVSDNNSKSGISWFPAGSDLARIRLDKYNELAPWVGLY